MTAATDAKNASDDGNPAPTTDVQSVVNNSPALADAAAALDAQGEDVLSLQVGSGQTMEVTVPAPGFWAAETRIYMLFWIT